MTSARTIAAAQTVPVRGDVDANVVQHLALVQAASEAQAHVLVFPELSLTGYELDLAAELAFTEQDVRLAPLASAAAACGTTLIVGGPVRIDGRLHIGAFIVSQGGRVTLYTKQHLGAFPTSASANGIVPAAEETVFHPGSRNPAVHFGEHTAAVAVCADIHWPSHPQEASDRRARTYLASMFIIPSELEKDTATLRAHAVRHQMAVVLANYGGPTGGLPSGGCSTIWSEDGEVVAQLPTTGAGVVVATESQNGWRAATTSL